MKKPANPLALLKFEHSRHFFYLKNGSKRATMPFTSHINTYSPMLLNPKHRKILNIIWGVIVVIIILSMVALYLPALYR
jgi:hypothetical protein